MVLGQHCILRCPLYENMAYIRDLLMCNGTKMIELPIEAQGSCSTAAEHMCVLYRFCTACIDTFVFTYLSTIPDFHTVPTASTPL